MNKDVDGGMPGLLFGDTSIDLSGLTGDRRFGEPTGHEFSEKSVLPFSDLSFWMTFYTELFLLFGSICGGFRLCFLVIGYWISKNGFDSFERILALICGFFVF